MKKMPVVAAKLVVLLWVWMIQTQIAAKDKNESEPIKGPVAVIALVAGGDFEHPVRLAGEVNYALVKDGKIEVIETKSLAARLGEHGPYSLGRVDFERLEGLFQQGYLQSYSFEYQKALDTLNQVIEGLEKLPSTEEHWNLWIDTKIFQGIAYMGLGDEKAAMESFTQVLRTRPQTKLNKKKYSPKFIESWGKAKRRLAQVPRGRLSVDSDPSGVKVLLDGVVWGKTPLRARLPHGRYRLELQESDTSYMERYINVSKEPLDLRYQMAFEGALVLDRDHPCVRIPHDQKSLPMHWWPWLGARLHLRHLITVQHSLAKNRSRLSAALIDLERGRQIREGWLEISDLDTGKLKENALDLAKFLITGQAVDRLEIRTTPTRIAKDSDSFSYPQKPAEVDIELRDQRPWYRSWWPYTIAASASLVMGITGHLGASNYQSKADQANTVQERESLESKSDAWTVVAISGYVLAAGCAITGAVLSLQYTPEKSQVADLEINLGMSIQGLALWGRF